MANEMGFVGDPYDSSDYKNALYGKSLRSRSYGVSQQGVDYAIDAYDFNKNNILSGIDLGIENYNFQKDTFGSLMGLLGIGGGSGGAAGGAGGAIGSMIEQNLLMGKAKAAADRITGSVADVNMIGDRLVDYSSTLWGEGTDLYNLGSSLLNGTADPNSILGKFQEAIQQINPERYRELASADVQKSYDAALGESQRAMSRQGASTNASASMVQQWAQALASATASAKTIATQKGIQDQKAALKEGVDTATGMMKSGAEIQHYGSDAAAQAGTMYTQGGDLLAKQSQAYTAAGQQKSAQYEQVLGLVKTIGGLAGGVNDAAGLAIGALGQRLSAQEIINATNDLALLVNGDGDDILKNSSFERRRMAYALK